MKSPQRSHERGASIISASIGFLVVMTFLLIGIHVLLVMHTRTMVRAAAFDAARVVARSESASTGPGEQRIASLIGKLKPRSSWNTSANGFVTVTINAKSPGVAPFGLLQDMKNVSITARVRREAWQP
jgi:Flp pilus assembly protein TadG